MITRMITEMTEKTKTTTFVSVVKIPENFLILLNEHCIEQVDTTVVNLEKAEITINVSMMHSI